MRIKNGLIMSSTSLISTLPVTTATASSSAPNSGFIQLFDDGIRSVFQFLNYYEVPRLGQVSFHFQRMEKLFAEKAGSLDLSARRWNKSLTEILDGAMKKYPHITSLNLSNWHNLSPADLTRALTRWQGITDLNLNACQMIEQPTMLQEYFAGKSGVRLTLPAMVQFHAGLTRLFTTLDFQSLRVLDISNPRTVLGFQTITFLASRLSTCEQLEEFKAPVVRGLFNGCFQNLPQTIQRLNLQAARITDELFDIIIPKLNTMALRHFSLRFSQSCSSLKLEQFLAELPIERLVELELLEFPATADSLCQLRLRLSNAKNLEVINVGLQEYTKDSEVSAFVFSIHSDKVQSLRFDDRSSRELSDPERSLLIEKINSFPDLKIISLPSVNLWGKREIHQFLIEEGVRQPSAAAVAKEVEVKRLSQSQNELHQRIQTLLKGKLDSLPEQLLEIKEQFSALKSKIEARLDEFYEVDPLTTPIAIAKYLEEIQNDIERLEYKLKVSL